PTPLPAPIPPHHAGPGVAHLGQRSGTKIPPAGGLGLEGAQSTVVPRPHPGELFDQMTQQIFGVAQTADMSGFLFDYGAINPADPNQIMQSYSPSQVPVISQLAKEFAVSDAWFASAPCQTWPNRGFVHTGSADGHINDDHSEPYDIHTVF